MNRRGFFAALFGAPAAVQTARQLPMSGIAIVRRPDPFPVMTYEVALARYKQALERQLEYIRTLPMYPVPPRIGDTIRIVKPERFR